VIHLDTTFIIDLLRESKRGKGGAATARLASWDEDVTLGTSVYVLCELEAGAHGADDTARERLRYRRILGGVEIAYPDERFAERYGLLCATLERAGQRIGNTDLLIATAAILADAPIVTRNGREFSRVPGLRVIAY
jgi:predicted nucleic acid-binding protein